MTDLTLPPGTDDKCKHEEVLKRVKPPQPQYVCPCGERLTLVAPQYFLLAPEQLKRFNSDRAAAAKGAQRRSLGLVLPDEARQLKQQEGQKR